jgi:hypothetical protein
MLYLLLVWRSDSLQDLLQQLGLQGPLWRSWLSVEWLQWLQLQLLECWPGLFVRLLEPLLVQLLGLLLTLTLCFIHTVLNVWLRKFLDDNLLALCIGNIVDFNHKTKVVRLMLLQLIVDQPCHQTWHLDQAWHWALYRGPFLIWLLWLFTLYPFSHDQNSISSHLSIGHICFLSCLSY